MSTSRTQKGFTLVEMIVSLGLFTIVLFITTSAFLAIVSADRKSRVTRVAIDNLNLTLENMARKIKTGTVYYCGENATGARDCPLGAPSSSFSFNDQTSTPSAPVRIIYKLAQGSGAIGGGVGCGNGYSVTQGCILRSDNGGTTFMLSTSPEIDITGLNFLVSGSAPWGVAAGQDKKQPTVVIAINGSLGSSATMFSAKSAFKIQTVLTARAYDH